MKKKNIFFIILVFVLISAIVSLNYFVDPYRMFARKSIVLNTLDTPINALYLRMKIYKQKSPETLVIGLSETSTLFSHHCFRLAKFNLVSLNVMPYKILSDILNNYLKINPQTKNVVIFLSYMPFFEISYIKKAPIYTSDNISLGELSNFLLSHDVTRKSINILKRRHYYKKNPHKRIVFEDCQTSYPKQMHSFHDPKNYQLLQKINESNLKYILQITSLLKEKNIECSIVIPPYNAVFLALIDEFDFEKQIVEKLKRYLVDNIPSDIPIYDMAFVNEYTSVNLLDENDDMYYFNYNHPNEFFGVEVYKILFDKKNEDSSLYMLLSKQNIDAVLQKQKQLLVNYKLQNKNLIDFYSDVSFIVSKNKAKDYFSFKRKLFKDEYSNRLRSNFDYIESLCPKSRGKECHQ